MTLHYGCLGNGTTVYDVDRLRSSDYVNVAHIAECGSYRLYEHLPAEEVENIKRMGRADAEKFRAHFLTLDKYKRLAMIEHVARYSDYKTDMFEMTAEEHLEVYLTLHARNCGYTRL